jgi:predicted amidophosphoribosyltransferase
LFCSKIAKKLKRKQGLETQRKKSEQIVIVPLNHWCTFVQIKNTAEIKKNDITCQILLSRRGGRAMMMI